MTTILQTARALANGALSARALTEQALDRLADPDGEGPRAFLHVDPQGARRSADMIDAARRQGRDVPPFAGIGFSVKDLFDQAGLVTRAGSRVLEDAAPAEADAPAIGRLVQAGMIPLGRSVMTEFAFSGVGINPHYGTPASPYERSARRIAGGSSSGAAVSVSDGMALLGTGSDTGGSCRIPAALCGVVGVKPTQSLIDRAGTIPLSPTLDTVGAFGRSVACARIGVRLMAGQATGLEDAPIADLRGLRLGICRDYVTDDMDADVARAWDRALARLSAAGATLVPMPFPELRDIPAMNAKGGFAAPESLAWHRPLIARAGDRYDPFVLKRILRGQEPSAVEYLDLLAARAALMAAGRRRMAGMDAMLMPSVPVVAPRIDALVADEALHAAVNLLLLRNTSIANLLDLCALSLPCHDAGEAPVGLGVVGHHGRDEALFAVGAAIERVFL